MMGTSGLKKKKTLRGHVVLLMPSLKRKCHDPSQEIKAYNLNLQGYLPLSGNMSAVSRKKIYTHIHTHTKNVRR